MKKIVLVFGLMVAMNEISFGQGFGDDFYTQGFEDTTLFNHLEIDSIYNHNHLWQIGNPQKTVFTSGHSLNNAIVKDTSSPIRLMILPVLKLLMLQKAWLEWPLVVTFSWYCEVNSDTLTHFGKIEFSSDNGISWIDLINDATYNSYYDWYTAKPVLLGNSNVWQSFEVSLSQLGPLFNIQYTDTFCYRFTLISDNIQTNKDGLMYNDFHFEDWVEGIQEYQSNKNISLFPNPLFTTSTLQIQSTLPGKVTVSFYNILGQTILTKETDDRNIIINRKDFNLGIFFYRIAIG